MVMYSRQRGLLSIAVLLADGEAASDWFISSKNQVAFFTKPLPLYAHCKRNLNLWSLVEIEKE